VTSQLIVADEELRKLALLADGRDEDGHKISPPPTAAQLREAMRDGYAKLWRRYPPDLPADQKFDFDDMPDTVVPGVKQSPRTRRRPIEGSYEQMARDLERQLRQDGVQ